MFLTKADPDDNYTTCFTCETQNDGKQFYSKEDCKCNCKDQSRTCDCDGACYKCILKADIKCSSKNKSCVAPDNNKSNPYHTPCE